MVVADLSALVHECCCFSSFTVMASPLCPSGACGDNHGLLLAGGRHGRDYGNDEQRRHAERVPKPPGCRVKDAVLPFYVSGISDSQHWGWGGLDFLAGYPVQSRASVDLPRTMGRPDYIDPRTWWWVT